MKKEEIVNLRLGIFKMKFKYALKLTREDLDC